MQAPKRKKHAEEGRDDERIRTKIENHDDLGEDYCNDLRREECIVSGSVWVVSGIVWHCLVLLLSLSVSDVISVICKVSGIMVCMMRVVCGGLVVCVSGSSMAMVMVMVGLKDGG